MAQIPQDDYPGKVDTTDSGYPLGKAQDDPDPNVGTPLLSGWINDWWGFAQSLLDAAGLVPSGNPDKVGASQYLEAVVAVVQANAAAADSVPWGGTDNEFEKLADYPIVSGDKGKLLYLGAAVIANTVFTVDAGFPDDGIFWIANRANTLVGGGLSGEVTKLTIYDGTYYYTPVFYGDGIKRVSKSSLTGELEFGNG